MTDKRFEINNNMNLDSKVETYELSCLVDNDNKTFYFVVDNIANVESFVERLNELHEENQDLECKLAEKHQDLTELGLKYGDILDIKIANEVIDNQRNTIKELSEENEHYKSIFLELVETALTDKNCRELYCKGILDIFDKANSLNQARQMIKEHLK